MISRKRESSGSRRRAGLAVPVALAGVGLLLAACETGAGNVSQQDGVAQVAPTQLERQLDLRPEEYGVYSNMQLAKIKSVVDDPTITSYWKKQQRIRFIKSQSDQYILPGVKVSNN